MKVGQRARRHVPGRNLVATVPEHQRLRDVEGEGGRPHGAHAQHDALVGFLQRFVGGLVELIQARSSWPRRTRTTRTPWRFSSIVSVRTLIRFCTFIQADAQQVADPPQREDAERHEGHAPAAP